MSGLTVGIYGKLPSQPDFVSDSVVPEVSNKLYEWAQESLYYSKQALGDSEWLSHYLVSPIWRTCIAFEDTEQNNKFVTLAIMVPSVDSAGRFFPLFLMFELDVEFVYLEWLFRPASEIYQALEECALEALQKRLTATELRQLINQKTASFDIRHPHSIDALSDESLSDYSTVQYQGDDANLVSGVPLRKLKRSFWWTRSELNGVKYPFVRCHNLPTPKEYEFLLTGNVENLEQIPAMVEL